MHALNTLLLSFLAPLAIHAAALPATPADSKPPANIAPQAPTCYNAPGHRAGTLLNARSQLAPDLSARAYTTTTPPVTTWCAAHSRTFVTFTYISRLPLGDTTSPAQFVLSAHSVLASGGPYGKSGETALAAGLWEYHQDSYKLSVQGKGMTYAAAERAAMGVYEYSTGFLVRGGWAPGALSFVVWDGPTQIGTGSLSRMSVVGRR